MPTYTKYVIAHWIQWPDANYYPIRDQALYPLVEAEKTDGTYEKLGEFGMTIRRSFTDQASSEEWQNWLLTNTSRDHLSSVEIQDIPV